MTIPTTEMLIIVDQYVDESCKLLNTRMYGNANVRIMSPNGLWCLSEKYSKPRVFKKVHRWGNIGELWNRNIEIFFFCLIDHSAKEFKYDTHIANLNGRKLVTFAYDDLPFVYMDIDKTNNGISAGFSTGSKSKQMWKLSLNN